MVSELHKMNIKLMVSVWSKIDKQSEVGKDMLARGYYIPDTDWIDFFNPDAARAYWEHFSCRMLKPLQIDAWWFDATEPENDDLYNRRINNGTSSGNAYRNVYPLYVTKTIYEGLRRDDPTRRAFIFTRSGFSGMQRYAAATWSGDVGNDWQTLRRQISGGLGQMATGLPWWTYDAGGFFRPRNQYTARDYHERLIRWFEAATFFPLQRVHGYMSNTEPWRYGELTDSIIKKYINLRYRMLPYIYSHAAEVALKGSTLMRPLVMDFTHDTKALQQNVEYMFGKSLLVSPVVSEGVNSWETYLPEHKAGWFDFWTNRRYDGGTTVSTDAPLQTIPLFVKAGSIMVFAPEKQYASESTGKPYEIRIYQGKDAAFDIYEDEGTNYNYENGQYAITPLIWNNSHRILTIEKRKGEFAGMEKERKYRVVLVGDKEREVVYNGEKCRVVF